MRPGSQILCISDDLPRLCQPRDCCIEGKTYVIESLFRRNEKAPLLLKLVGHYRLFGAWRFVEVGK